MEAKITIAIPNWNGCEDTLECLLSLSGQSYDNHEVVVVDNGSTDNSVKMIKEEYKDTIILEIDKNTGFTGACNAAMEHAVKSGSEYIFLLNNDTVIDAPDFLSRISGYMESHNDIGMLSPIVLYADTGKIWFGGGDVERNTGIVKLWNQGSEYIVRDYCKLTECSFLAGCALFIRTDVMQAAGGLYEPYFLTSEESELCIRINDMGYKLAVTGDVYLYHKVSQSMGAESPLLVYFMYRNKLIFVKRNAIHIRLSDIFKVSVYIARGLFSFTIKGKLAQAMSILRGVIDYLRGIEGKGYYSNIL